MITLAYGGRRYDFFLGDFCMSGGKSGFMAFMKGMAEDTWSFKADGYLWTFCYFLPLLSFGSPAHHAARQLLLCIPTYLYLTSFLDFCLRTLAHGKTVHGDLDLSLSYYHLERRR